ncbi:methyltransferase, TIGR04325 family [Helicobacter pametensis]|uniref:methyltransferase, TIGR04325 family n=1 Tax=Helicobacter pametensis TaxID=95149 RepID=UPI000484CD79|nr:methyltransferase, TIGR04325 family [Helicobacter pametensis]
MKQLIKSLIPPIILQIINKISNRNIQWVGDYSTWQEASLQVRGYDPDIYLQKLIDITKIVRDDESKCERDSVLFDQITHPYPLLSNLFSIVTHLQTQSLYILDFGGSLGSLYFQNRKFFRLLPHLTWNILEQDKIIDAGKRYFESPPLFFHSTIKDAKVNLKSNNTKILILSSVLQYLENPYSTLQWLLSEIDFDAIIIDRTPFSRDQQHRIIIQKVPQKIYKTQYPCHLFSKQDFLEFIDREGYSLFDEFESYCDAHTSRFKSLGFSFLRKK